MSSKNSPLPHQGKTAVVIGGGAIGASWAALFLVNGLRVIVSDPDPAIASKVRAVVEAALPALSAMGYEDVDIDANLAFDSDTARAARQADVVQECGPERLALKQALWKTIEAAAPAQALLLSSSSSIPASGQAALMKDPSRLLVGHPLNPPHLMPLVEVVPTPDADPALVERALAFYGDIGKVARTIRKEIPGFVANRLQAAIFRESVFLVREGIVTIDELDDIVTNSLGIRWATSGPFLAFHLSGGSGGLTHFLEHLGPPMEAAWKHLGTATLDDATRALLIDQLDSSYGMASFEDLSELRDAREINVIESLFALGGPLQRP